MRRGGHESPASLRFMRGDIIIISHGASRRIRPFMRGDANQKFKKRAKFLQNGLKWTHIVPKLHQRHKDNPMLRQVKFICAFIAF